MEHTYIKRAPRVEGRPPKVNTPGRRCPQCDTPLSRYNPGPHCYGHAPFKAPRIRGRA